jgi:hypothetical protein
MKYILNTGRYALSFEIVKGGLKKTIVLERRRLYNDTGNVAVAGITAIEDEDYKLLTALPIFKKRFADKNCGLSEITEEQAIGKSDAQANKLAEENKKLKEEKEALEKAVKESKNAKAMKELADENASLKAQLEALQKKDASEPVIESGEAGEAGEAGEVKADKANEAEDEGF